jgi:RNA polymerase sigma factor (sigma-70 family)
LNKHKDIGRISEINLAAFEEICQLEQIKEIIKNSKSFKKFLAYYKKLSKKKIGNGKEGAGGTIFKKENVGHIVDFVWESATQRALLKRIKNKDNIVKNWMAYLRSTIYHIINEKFCLDIKNMKDPDSNIQDHNQIRTIKRYRKNVSNLEDKLKREGKLSSKDHDALHEKNWEMASLKSLIDSIGTTISSDENGDGHDILAIQDEDIFGTDGRRHCFSPEEVILDKEKPQERHRREGLVQSVLSSKLKEKHLQVLQKYYWEGLTQREIGDIFECTTSNISQMRKRALKKLKKNERLRRLYANDE